MKLFMQVGLGPGNIVLDGDPAPLPKGRPASNLSATSFELASNQLAIWNLAFIVLL